MGTISSPQTQQIHETLGPYRLLKINVAHPQSITLSSNISTGSQPLDHLEITRTISNQLNYATWLSQLELIQRNPTAKDFILLPQTYHLNRNCFCSDFATLTVPLCPSQTIFEDYRIVLQHQIVNRRKCNIPYAQQQVWYMLFRLAQAALIFQKLSCKLGDIHTKNILLNESGYMKVWTMASLPDLLSNFDKIVEHRAACVNLGTMYPYTAPQQLSQHDIQKGVNPSNDLSKSQVFSFGMTVLQIATLHPSSDMYLLNPVRVIQGRIKERIALVKAKYSQSLYNAIAATVEINCRKRISFGQICRILAQYQSDIENLKPARVVFGQYIVKG